MSDDLSQLEQQLSKFGREELAVELKLRTLRQLGKNAVTAGRLEEADAAWALYEESRKLLGTLRSEITRVETRLYALRRQRRT